MQIYNTLIKISKNIQYISSKSIIIDIDDPFNININIKNKE